MSILNRKKPNQTHQQFIVILPRSWKQHSYCINIVTDIFRHNINIFIFNGNADRMENNENFYIHSYLIVSSISRSELKAKRKKTKLKTVTSTKYYFRSLINDPHHHLNKFALRMFYFWMLSHFATT